MARTRSEKRASEAQTPLASEGKTTGGRVGKDKKTDYSRWRLLDERGRQTWQYLRTDEEVKKWPQSVADKYHLGLPTVSSKM
jgi:lanosterol synthase